MKINNKTDVDLMFVKLMMKFENIMSKMMEQSENLRPAQRHLAQTLKPQNKNLNLSKQSFKQYCQKDQLCYVLHTVPINF